jgi:SAM-dependent methyltransferase
MYLESQEQVAPIQEAFRKRYKPFTPYRLTPEDSVNLLRLYQIGVTSQNGQDFDDCAISEGSPVYKYTKGIPPGSKILFLGTGTGREVKAALSMGWDAHGTTLGSRNIQFAREELGLGPDRVMECLNENLPFGSQTFDHVHGYQVFEHAMSPIFVLLEIHRVLKPGGKILLEWPSAAAEGAVAWWHHQICYAPGQVGALLTKASFRDIRLFTGDDKGVPDEGLWRADWHGWMCASATRGEPVNEETKKYLQQRG